LLEGTLGRAQVPLTQPDLADLVLCGPGVTDADVPAHEFIACTAGLLLCPDPGPTKAQNLGSMEAAITREDRDVFTLGLALPHFHPLGSTAVIGQVSACSDRPE